MKKILFTLIPCLFTTVGYRAMAQEDIKTTDDKKESQEIIIRKKGDKDATISIQISGDKVTINGKPLVEFKDDAITINKRNIIVRDGDRISFSGEGLRELAGIRELESLGNLSWDDEGDDHKAGAFLGVVTEKNEKGAKISDITGSSAAAIRRSYR